MARREDDKCASYGSLFIGQSSGTQVETEHGRRKPVGAGEAGEIRCEIRFAPKQVWTLWGRAEKPGHWKGGYWGGQFTPRGTTYVFVNVVVAPRYVARLRLGSGGLKRRTQGRDGNLTSHIRLVEFLHGAKCLAVLAGVA